MAASLAIKGCTAVCIAAVIMTTSSGVGACGRVMPGTFESGVVLAARAGCRVEPDTVRLLPVKRVGLECGGGGRSSDGQA
jgi:hypothetical protein